MSEVDVNISALEALREDLGVFGDNQQRAVAGIDHQVEETIGTLQALRGDWEREGRRRQAALSECEMAAMLAAAAGEYVDCSGPAAALQEAREELGRVESWIGRVEEAGSGWHGSADHYDSYMGSAIPTMRAGLDARVTSLEAYHGWRVGQVALTGGAADGGLGALATRVAELRREKAAEEQVQRGQPSSAPTTVFDAGSSSTSSSSPEQASDHYPPGAGYGVEDREGPTLGPERRG